MSSAMAGEIWVPPLSSPLLSPLMKPNSPKQHFDFPERLIGGHHEHIGGFYAQRAAGCIWFRITVTTCLKKGGDIFFFFFLLEESASSRSCSLSSGFLQDSRAAQSSCSRQGRFVCFYKWHACFFWFLFSFFLLFNFFYFKSAGVLSLSFRFPTTICLCAWFPASGATFLQKLDPFPSKTFCKTLEIEHLYSHLYRTDWFLITILSGLVTSIWQGVRDDQDKTRLPAADLHLPF